MADPTIYSVTYSFTGYQVNAPGAPLPAPQLDNELLNVATSIASIVLALKDVRRTDGALPNNIVTFDSLALGLQLLVDPTNGELVAAAIAQAQANATASGASASAAAASAAAALTQALAAAASAASVNFSNFLAKANNLAGLGSQSTSRGNLGLGSVATFDVGGGANNIVQLDGNAKIPAYDGSQITGIDVLPVGTTILVASLTAPAGTVKENGALLSRATYPRLWAFAQASSNIVTEAGWGSASNGAFSTGDLSTTFRIPDARGEFLRMFDSGRGVDGSRGINVWQADSLATHTHNLNAGAPFYVGSTDGTSQGGSTNPHTPQGATLIAATTSNPSTGTAAETRPRNISKLACIKY